MIFFRFLIITEIFLVAQKVHACPFCDFGGEDAAYFIVSLFGFFILGMGMFFCLFVMRGGLKNSQHSAQSILEIEKGETQDGFRN